MAGHGAAVSPGVKPYLTHLDAATLAAQLDHPDWLVIDVRHQLADPGYGERAYAEAHVAGARFLHCDRDLAGPLSGRNGRHPLPDPALFAATGLFEIVKMKDGQSYVADKRNKDRTPQPNR